MSRQIIVRAPAKTNLSLRVTGKRDDGFHGVETEMVKLSLADTVTMEVVKGPREIRFTCDDPDLPADGTNLAVKAAHVFLDHAGWEKLLGDQALSIHLEKKIPVGAGLGGGSSDAAAVLLGLNDLFETKIPRETLRELAAGLGSDVPFFIFESSATCTGRGEIVEPHSEETHSQICGLPVILLKPPFPVSAAFAYSKWADSSEVPTVFYGEQRCPWGVMVNDLERPVFQKHLVLAQMKQWLLGRVEVRAAIMSGSGSTMLAVISSYDQRAQVVADAEKEFGKTLWSCQTRTV